MSLAHRSKEYVRMLLTPVLYRYPPFALQPERLYRWLHAVIETEHVDGDVVEVGCNIGGTTVITKKMLDHLGIGKRYVCIDTFDGFVASQFEADTLIGTPKEDLQMFSGSSKRLVRKILHQHGSDGVDLIQADIVQIEDSALPERCSLVLADVDLVEPTYATLEKFWPRLAPKGMILVDDCGEETSWKARIAYQRFCRDQALQERYEYGFGVLVKT